MNKLKFLSVLLPINIDRPFTYSSEKNLDIGTIVKVSFGKRELYGVVWEADKKEKKPDNIKIKPIAAKRPTIRAFSELRSGPSI